jgi:Glycoside-hydrolase family GH114
MSRWFAIVLALLLLLASGAPAAAAIKPLPVGPDVDYQLGGVRSVPPRVGIVARDRTARPLAGAYNICYVNGFQTQADERGFWRQRMGLVLHRRGRPVVDSAWGEWLLDLRTATKRARLARIIGAWTRGCARSGFDAVEFDNLDSYTRSHRLLTRSQAIAYARLLVRAAHSAGLAAGQKNLADFNGHRVGYDFAVAEECGRYRECSDYTTHYGRRVIAIEYRSADFRWTCSHYGVRLAVVRRDLALSPSGVRAWC